jgi:tetratricopeptide (TPR) repeat protein
MGAADVFFAKARQLLNAGNLEYAIEMYLQGLNIEPDNLEAHQALREISLQRRAAGGRALGMFDKMRFRSALRKAADDKAKMLAAEKLLAYEPADLSILAEFIRLAHAAGCAATAAWA